MAEIDWDLWPFPADADPYAAYRAARERAPDAFDPGVGARIVLSHAAAEAILKDAANWSSDPRNSSALTELLGGATAAGLWADSLLMSDPPVHTRLRAAVNRFFTPRAMERIRHRVAPIVATATEPLADGAPVELMGELAYPIPVAVISELFDVGVEGAELLRDHTPDLARMLELELDSDSAERVATAAMSLMLFLVPIVAARRIDPGDDLISALAHPGAGEPGLETDEIVRICLLLLAAGHETTANVIGNGMLALLEHPGELRRLAEHPDLTRRAIEELIRYDSPAQVAVRANRDGGVALIVLGAANRDPARYEEPDRLDLTRTQPGHLAFGRGPHFCVGAGLARIEAEETFARLAPLATTWCDGGWEAVRKPSRTFRRLDSLTVVGGPPGPPNQTRPGLPATAV